MTLFNRDVHAWAEDFINRHGIDLTNRYVHDALERLVGVGNKQLVAFGVIAIIYAALLFTEGIGLWLQKRWAEYLTAFATALFIPIELYELYERFTWVRISILVLNIFVVWYLVTRLKDEKKDEATTVSMHSLEQIGTRVKICGITNLEDAELAVRFGADEFGFNFYEKSPRYISPARAREIIDKLPSTSFNIGVFVNESINGVLETAKIAGLDAIQLHGDEDNRFIEETHTMSGLPIIKAIQISSQFDTENIKPCSAEAILLDKYSPKQFGGTGETFDWNIAKQISAQFRVLYLAGGLTSENVADAVRIVKPYAVDVASGVESAPGKKDEQKLYRFITAAKEAI